jgi:hypothetical protein
MCLEPFPSLTSVLIRRRGFYPSATRGSKPQHYQLPSAWALTIQRINDGAVAARNPRRQKPNDKRFGSGGPRTTSMGSTFDVASWINSRANSPSQITVLSLCAVTTVAPAIIREWHSPPHGLLKLEKTNKAAVTPRAEKSLSTLH